MNNLTVKASLFLLRGLPGSGKSTLARALSEHGKYPIVSVDDYFTDEETGHYHFRYQENHLAYEQCLRQTENYLKKNVEKIFVHNTFTMSWEMEPYFKLAQQFHAQLFVITVENYHGHPNTHGVSREQVEKMASKYQVKLC